MNRSIIISVLLAALSITACNNKPTVANTPAEPADTKSSTGNDGAVKQA